MSSMGDYDVAIAACRPVQFTPAELDMLADMPAEATPPIYPGSVVQQCEQCFRPIYVGPKAQEVIASGQPVQVMCFLCSVEAAAVADAITTVQNLGNPYTPELPS